MNRTAAGISFLLLLGVAYMVTCNGCSGSAKYDKYSSTDPELNMTMDYIPGWQYRETRGSNNSYADVFFGEPRNKGEEKGRKAFISATSVKIPDAAMPADMLDRSAESFAESRLKYKEGKLLGRAKLKIPAGEAVELSFSYKALDKLYNSNAKLAPVEEKVVMLINGGRFYTVRYENKEDDFKRFDKDFDHIVKSIRFKEKR